MTSGNFKSFPVSEIWVDRTKRQRRELTGIEELAESIARTGLINPPVIRQDGELVAGERRWTAIKSLGWTHVPVQFVEDLSELELHLVEYEENIRRIDLPWQDQCLAVKHYHDLRAESDPEWNAQRTAEALGITSEEASKKRMVAEEIEAGNERVIAAERYSTARGIVERNSARKKSSVLATISLDKPMVPRAENVELVEQEIAAKRVVPLLNADFHDWIVDYDGPTFNVIHCDFPYGVGMDKSDQGSGKSFGTYADSPEDYWQLLRSLELSMKTVVSESAHLIFWFSMDFYSETFEILSGMGWKVQKHPLIWMKSDNTGILPDPARGPRRIYETAFFASRGDRQIVRPVANAFSYPGRQKELHMNEKPVAMLKHFMGMVVDKYSLVLDPTAGSANALKAGTALEANFVLGLERDPEFFRISTEGYYNDEL